jgi:hypothetical protein
VEPLPIQGSGSLRSRRQRELRCGNEVPGVGQGEDMTYREANGTTMYEITHSKRTTNSETVQRCAHCGFHPASPRISGYCSWDCYEAADDEEGDDSDGRNAA